VVVKRKAAVVRAVRSGRLSLLEAIRRYGITVEEFLAWERALERIGVHGLRVTRLQIYDELRDDAAENGVPKAGFIEAILRARRSIGEALGDLVVKHSTQPSPNLARMIKHLEIECAVRGSWSVAAWCCCTPRCVGGAVQFSRVGILRAGRRRALAGPPASGGRNSLAPLPGQETA